MGELATYSLIDFIPFTRTVYLRLFERLNATAWPAHLFVLPAGAVCLWLARTGRGRALGLLAGLCWGSVAWFYLLDLYANLNWAGTYFGWAFVGQGVLVAAAGFTGRLDRPRSDPPDLPTRLGLALAAAALVLFPAAAPIAGRSWVGAEFFGLAPDPTALATLGLVAAADRPPWFLLPVPVVWSLISAATSWAIGGWSGLLAGLLGLAGLSLSVWRLAT